jgi:hypothetical protein
MALLNSIFSWVMKKRIHQIELFVKHPHEVQEELLKQLLRTAKNTEWGRQWDFDSITTYEEFKRRLPIQNYEDIKETVDRLMAGEQNLLWPSEIKWFSKSSGTTSSKSKFIPVSAEALEDCHFKAGKDMLSIHCYNHPYSKFFDGKSLMLAGSKSVNQLSSGSYYGDLSAILVAHLPKWAGFRSTPDQKIALMDEWEQKLERIAEITIKEKVTSFTGVPSWMLVLAQKVLEKTNSQNLLEVWPSLELFLHGGVNFAPYRAQFEKLIPSSDMNYLETYNASEGFFGIQDQSNSPEMLLMLDYGIFYEFIPMSEYGKENPKVIPLWEVEMGVNYALIITTNAGLWRYIIGDTLTFSSLGPYRFKITGRTKHFINAFGEELIMDNAEKALQKACQLTGAMIHEYTAAPVYLNDGDSGAHEWCIEFVTLPDNLEAFKKELDRGLMALNSDYEAKRYKNLVLNPPIVRIARKGLFYDWMKKRDKLGGQNKVPRLSNERKYLEDILTLNHLYV